MAKNKYVNIASGNARVGTQIGGANIRDNGNGTYTVNGKSVGTPAVSGCGCPGADTFYYDKGVKICSRCRGAL
jgi:hypothetical protein